ncbi:MAG: hypothetical protein AB7S93_19565 [Xanthobacteraceae bacterium]
MASTLNVVFGAIVAAVVFSCVGLAVARRIAPPSLAWPFAPLLGWAVFSVVALPAFSLVGFSGTPVRLLTAVALAASLIALWRIPSELRPEGEDADAPTVLSAWAWLGAAVLAVGPALAILPKVSGESVLLASPIFDHSKIAIVDEMARLGLPPGNPFFGEVGQPVRLAYYYLFHFSAAVLALLLGITGWEAEAAMTWFAAFASLMLMMGLAAWIAGRPAAAYWVLPLALAASLRGFLALVLPSDLLRQLLQPASGFAAWLGHASWAPQHLISASCAVLAVWLMSQISRRGTPLLIVTLGLVAAAGFESSTWVGGVTFAAAALAVGVMLLAMAGPGQRRQFAIGIAMAAVLAACLAAPFILDQVIATAARDGGAPIALQPTAVLGEFLPEGWRRLLELPAFWLIYLPVEFPAVYPLGVIALAILIGSRRLDAERSQVTRVLAVLAAASLVVSWLFASRIGYNDLGWRAAIPGLMVLTIMSAVILARWIAGRVIVPVGLALLLLALGLYESVLHLRENATGASTPQGRVFARTPELWAAVRRHSAAMERVANNPLFLDRMTPWAGNISWALLSNRRSCFAGDQLLLAFASLPHARREDIDKQFRRVFTGDATAEDIRDLANRFDCALAVVTAQDGVWAKDPFAASPFYELTESKDGEWRIYRRRSPPRP